MLKLSKNEKFYLGAGLILLVILGAGGILWHDKTTSAEEIAYDMYGEVADIEKELRTIRDDLAQAQDNTREAVELREKYEERLNELAVILENYKKDFEAVTVE